ncbi:ABC transporter permease subunit [Microbacterium sp. M]|uniref:ABC transporter permease subunit n=1 Tax=Microbacterium sp. M TaxID=3377125 RepID=UPI00386AE153
MSTLTASAPETRTASPYGLSFGHALRSEWIKIATLRSTWWSIGITALLTVGIATLIASTVSAADQFPMIQAVVSPIQFTMLLAGILGAIAVTGEYSTGMIRSTLAAVPVRGMVLAAKAVVLGALLFVASLVIFFAAALVITPIAESKGLGLDWADFDVTIRPILLASAAMAVFALIGVAFGFILRSGAGAIAATVGLLFVLPIISMTFNMAGDAWQWIAEASRYLPMSAAQYAINPVPEGVDGLSPEVAYLTLAGWVVAGMLGAWAVLRTRDA